jgi:DNA processing protein
MKHRLLSAMLDYSRGKANLSAIWREGEFVDSSLDLFDDSSEFSHLSFVSFKDEEFPEQLYEKLGDSAPVVLSFEGNIGLFRRPMVGFCGARNVSDQGLVAAEQIASSLAENRITVVSGNAKGVDTAAHGSALRAGGSTIYVLPEGILKGAPKKVNKTLHTNSNYLTISEFYPSDIWQARRAMRRNRTIGALSDIMIVIEAGETGGTLNAGFECLKMGTPLYVVDYKSPSDSARGNKILLSEGGIPLKRDSETGFPRVDRIIDTLQKKGRL